MKSFCYKDFYLLLYHSYQLIGLYLSLIIADPLSVQFLRFHNLTSSPRAAHGMTLKAQLNGFGIIAHSLVINLFIDLRN